MKSLKHTVLLGTALFLTALSVTTSCTDGNDWNVDSSYDRLFGVNAQSISVDADVNTAALEWPNTPNTDYYVIEVSKDSLTDEIEMGKSNGAIVFGEDGSITTSPDTIRGLDADTKYFLRMKAMSKSGKGGSNWAYYKSSSFKTKTEQIIDEEATALTVTATTANIVWDKTKEVSRLTYVASGATDTATVELSDEDKAAGSYTLTGLKLKKTYIVTLFNGAVKRGSTKFTTAEELAPGYDQVDVTSSEVLADVFANPSKYIKGNGGSLVLVFQPGTNIDFPSEVTVPSAIKSIQFFGKSGGELPVLNTGSLDFEGTHETVRFYNVKMTSDGKGYVVNQKATGHVTNLQVENCEMSSLAAVVRNQSSTSDFENITINNCLMDKVGVGYAIVENKQESSVMNSVTVTNSTVSNSDTKGVVISSVTTPLDIKIESCTFYNSMRSGQYFVDDDAAKAKKGNVALTVNRVIIGKSYNYKDGNTVSATRTKKIASVTDVYTAKDFVYKKDYDFDGKTTSLSQTSSELFVAPDEGDFHIQKGIVTNAGDPRWLE